MMRFGAPGTVLIGDGGDHRRRGLERGALHVVFDASHAAHLLAASGAAWAAVDEDGEGESRGRCSRRHCRGSAPTSFHDRRRHLDELARGFGRVGGWREREAAHAAVRQRDGVGHVPVGHDR